MRQRDHKLQLIWDVDRFRRRINNVEIAVAPIQFPPFSTEAVVEEQDTSLVLGETNVLREPDDKPVWYFSNKLQTLVQLTPGEVIVRKSRPMRIQAIVHDLDEELTCNIDWVQQAVKKIIHATNSYHIHSLRTPLLGTRYSNLQPAQFIQILLNALSRQKPVFLNKIWLVTTEQQCESVFHELNSQLTHHVS
ncbi:MAG TPA: hypothetical protein VIM41_15815 [Gammaproteobacteria bacterium]